MKQFLPVVLCVAVLATGCRSADSKAIADATCACIDPIEKKLTRKSEAILNKAMEDGNVEGVLQSELAEVGDESERQKLADEIDGARQVMGDTKFQTCLGDVDQKNKVMKTDEKKITKEVITQLEKDCPIGANLMKLGLKKQGKSLD